MICFFLDTGWLYLYDCLMLRIETLNGVRIIFSFLLTHSTLREYQPKLKKFTHYTFLCSILPISLCSSFLFHCSCWWWIWKKFCAPRELRSRTIHIGKPCNEKYPKNEIRNQVSWYVYSVECRVCVRWAGKMLYLCIWLIDLPMYGVHAAQFQSNSLFLDIVVACNYYELRRLIYR